jgi:hypothetical protein
MKLVNDKEDPHLVGILDSDGEALEVIGWIGSLNRDLTDSGYEKYQYEVVTRGKKVYIEQKKGA